MENREVDVLIIGGGPAGLAAGIVCANGGLRTMVCEKRKLPADKACGEGVMPSGLVYLERLGVKQLISRERYFPFDGIRYVSQGGNIARANFREGPGWGIPRLELSRALFERTRELQCLEIRTGVQAAPISTDSGGRHSRIWVRVGGEYVGARLLIGADGLNSTVRQWAGLQGSKGNHERWGARQHFQIPPWSQEVEVHWRTGLEAYVTPCGEDLVGVAFLWDRRGYPRQTGGAGLMPALLAAFPSLAARLRNSTVADSPLAVGPMQRRVTRPTADGVLLIGDAAGYLDALTGEGISLALAQALALEEIVVPIMLASGGDGLLTREDLASYEHAYRDIMRPYYRMTHMALWLSRHPAWAEQAIRMLGRQPSLFQLLLSANMGLVQHHQKQAISRQ